MTGDQGETLHSHMHEHGDGTMHNHFHRHAGAAASHEGDKVLGDCSAQGEEGALPWHSHHHGPEYGLVLAAKGVSFTFPRAKRPVFEGLSFEAHAGTMTAILGNNGAGKSTLLNLLASIASPTAGQVCVGGRNLRDMNRRETAQHIAYVTQQQSVPHLSVYDEVLLGRKPHVSWSVGERDRAVVAAAIERLGLTPFVDRYCDELSGGERQKVYIARAIAQETEVLLLDEPTSALDPKNQMEVLQVVCDVTAQMSLSTVMVIHDVNLALRFCDRFVLMRNGAIIARGGIDSLTDESLSQAYDMPMRIADVDGVKVAIAGMAGGS